MTNKPPPIFHPKPDLRSPLYHQFKQFIVACVEKGDFPVGKPILPELEMVRIYGISRMTVRRAMQELEHDGYITRVAGKGTFVLRTQLKRGLSRLNSFTEDMHEHGLQVSSRLLNFQTQKPPKRIAEALQVTPDDDIVFISRLRLAGEMPVAVNTSYLRLPAPLVITVEEMEASPSLWGLLERKGLHLTAADKTIEAIAATEAYAHWLNIPVGAPLLLVEGVVYDPNSIPVEFHQVISNSERYKYTLHLER